MDKQDKKMNFVTTRLSLPLFMVSRNSFKTPYESQKLRNYIDKNKADLTKYCQVENSTDNATFKRFREICGLEAIERHPYPQPYPLKIDRGLTTYKNWQLAPNRYGAPEAKYGDREGSKGTIFPKVHTNKSKVQKKKGIWRFYNIPTDTDRLFKPPNEKKGVFMSNARNKRATARCMVSHPTTCYRRPEDPGPTDHHSRYYDFSYNLIPPRPYPKPNPHLFYRQSCVPIKSNLVGKRHISFLPGPGRYETRYSNICPCDGKKTYMPNLQLLIEDQKRLKFRRLPYVKIPKRFYCSPDWRHVPGDGHRWLFKHKKKPTLKTPKRAVETKKSEKHLKLYADAKYLNTITNPKRTPISLRETPLPPYVPKIVYNTIAKRIIRKQVRVNKKIAFNSGQERFKDAERPLTLTAKQLAAIREALPPERRLQDYPVLTKRKSEIPTRYLEIPDHMRPIYVPKLRKRLFKFLPLPGAKVLVNESDIRADVHYDQAAPSGFFRKHLDERTYFRKSVLEAGKLAAEEVSLRPQESFVEQSQVSFQEPSAEQTEAYYEKETKRSTNRISVRLNVAANEEVES